MITVSKAHDCLNEFHPKNEKTYLGPTMLELKKDLKEAFRDDDFATVWKLVERLPIVSDAYGVSNEMAETRVICACVICSMGNFKKTSDLLKEAAGYYYSSFHQEAMVRWMLGCIYWQISGRENDAIKTWRNSIRIFDNIPKYDRFLSLAEIEWYKKWVKEMREDLRTVTEKKEKRVLLIKPKLVSPSDDNDYDEVNGNDDPRNDLPPFNIDEIPDVKDLTELTDGEIVWYRDDARKEFPHMGKIRAGDFDHRGVEELSEFISDVGELIEWDYRCFVFSEDKQVKIAASATYYTLEVIGHSMNDAGIDDKDIVLIHYQPNADSGDIVAGEVVDFDDSVSLKRFQRANGKIELKPESLVDGFDIHEFTKENEGFYVRGKVLAVFKSNKLHKEKFKLQTKDEIERALVHKSERQL